MEKKKLARLHESSEATFPSVSRGSQLETAGDLRSSQDSLRVCSIHTPGIRAISSTVEHRTHNADGMGSNPIWPIEKNRFKCIDDKTLIGLDGIPWLTESMTLSGSSNLPKSFGNGDVQANCGLEGASRRKSGAKYESFVIPNLYGYGR